MSSGHNWLRALPLNKKYASKALIQTCSFPVLFVCSVGISKLFVGHQSRGFTSVMPECRLSSAGLLLLAARSVLSMWCDGRPRSGQSRVSYHDITKSTSFDDGDWFESFRGQSLFDSHSSLHTVFIRIRCCFQSRAFTSSFRSLGRVARIVFFSQTVFT